MGHRRSRGRPRGPEEAAPHRQADLRQARRRARLRRLVLHRAEVRRDSRRDGTWNGAPVALSPERQRGELTEHAAAAWGHQSPQPLRLRKQGGCSYSFVNWAMLFSRLNRDMLTPGLSADGLQSVRSASTRRRRAPCPA